MNLIIKSENLKALNEMKEDYHEKIKCIYIDPPYNTGRYEFFTYKNSFQKEVWQNFMRERIKVSRDFLREDGFLAVAIDHCELFYLGLICDEIYGRENRLGIITVVHKPGGRNRYSFISPENEFMIIYAKNKKNCEFNNCVLNDEIKNNFDQIDERGKYRHIEFMIRKTKYLRENRPTLWYAIYVSKDLKHATTTKTTGYYEVYPVDSRGRAFTWKTTEQTFLNDYKNDQIVFKKENDTVVVYRKYRETEIIKSVWRGSKYCATSHGTNLLKKIIGKESVSYPKSLYTIIDTLKLMTSDDDIVLDFFAGSGTTAHAVLELNRRDGGNRQFILVEELLEHYKICVERVQK